MDEDEFTDISTRLRAFMRDYKDDRLIVLMRDDIEALLDAVELTL